LQLTQLPKFQLPNFFSAFSRFAFDTLISWSSGALGYTTVYASSNALLLAASSEPGPHHPADEQIGSDILTLSFVVQSWVNLNPAWLAMPSWSLIGAAVYVSQPIEVHAGTDSYYPKAYLN
jgi:hypothetical protein